MLDPLEAQCVRNTVKRYVLPWQDARALCTQMFYDYVPLFRRQGNFTICTLMRHTPIQYGPHVGTVSLDLSSRWSMFIGVTKRHPKLDQKNNPLQGRLEALSRAVRDLMRLDDHENYEPLSAVELEAEDVVASLINSNVSVTVEGPEMEEIVEAAQEAMEV